MAGPRSAQPPRGWALLRMQHTEPEIIRAVISGLMEGSSELGMGNLGKGGRKHLAEDVSDDTEGVGLQLQQNGDVTMVRTWMSTAALRRLLARKMTAATAVRWRRFALLSRWHFPPRATFFSRARPS